MIDTLFVVLTFCTALACALIAGVFFAFSSFVMKALARLPAPLGIAAMQSINVAAITPVFMAALFGTAAACLVMAAFSLSMWQKPEAANVLVGSMLYLVGTILVTIVFNVPRNDALAVANPAHGDSAALWADYVSTWTAWNHVRTAAALAAAALLTMALCVSRGEGTG